MQAVETPESQAAENGSRQQSTNSTQIMSKVGDYILELMIGKREPLEELPLAILEQHCREDRDQTERSCDTANQALSQELQKSRDLSEAALNRIKNEAQVDESTATQGACFDGESPLPSKVQVVCSKENLFNRVFSNIDRGKQVPRIEFFSQQKPTVGGILD